MTPTLTVAKGFTCEVQEICTCTGGVDEPVDPDTDVPMPEPYPMPDDCVCEPGAAYCAPVEVACDSDADCPTDWTCETLSGGSSDAPSVPCYEDPDTGETNCGEGRIDPNEEQVCLPPYWETWGGPRGHEGQIEDLTGSNEADPVGPTNTTGAVRPPSAGDGCTAAATRTPWLLGFGLLGLIGIRRRR